jgi:biopolymer transport protein ExbD
MARRTLSNTLQPPEEINISPLIDMVFILLIFFIVTTTFVEETGVEVDKPEASASLALEKQSIMIAITNDNKVVYGGQEIGLSGVRSVVRRLTRSEESPVIIQADRTVSAEMLVRVIDESKLGGAQKVSISTEAQK